MSADSPPFPENAEYVPDEEAADDFRLDERPYQVMPPLDPDEYDALRESIKKRGVTGVIHVNADNDVLDGHHRILALRELGLWDDDAKTPAYSVHAATDPEECRRIAWELNMGQRHLDDDQKKDLIGRRLIELDENDEWRPNHEIAETLGVSASWVREVRRRLEGSGNIRTTAEITTDTDGRRTEEDTTEKRAAVEEAIRSDPGRSNREIAREVGVSHPFVGGVRDELAVPDVPQWWTQTAHADDFWQYAVQPDGWDVTALHSDEPEGWIVWLRGRKFYESRDLLGRGENEGWAVARATVGSAVRAAEITGEFARNPTVYAERKADELRAEGYEFEYRPMPANTGEVEV